MKMLFEQAIDGPGFTSSTNLSIKELVMMENDLSDAELVKDFFVGCAKKLLNSEEAMRWCWE